MFPVPLKVFGRVLHSPEKTIRHCDRVTRAAIRDHGPPAYVDSALS